MIPWYSCTLNQFHLSELIHRLRWDVAYLSLYLPLQNNGFIITTGLQSMSHILDIESAVLLVSLEGGILGDDDRRIYLLLSLPDLMHLGWIWLPLSSAMVRVV